MVSLFFEIKLAPKGLLDNTINNVFVPTGFPLVLENDEVK
jgi:hypothetical protein